MSRSWRLSLPLLVIALLGFAVPAAQAAAPANDNFASASPLTLGAPVSGTTVGATAESASGEPASQYGGGPYNTVWYRWDSPAGFSGEMVAATRASVVGSTPEVSVFTGSPNSTMPTLNRVAEYQDIVDFTAAPSTTYWIQIDSYAQSAPAAFTLTLQRGGTIDLYPTPAQKLCVILDPDADGNGTRFLFIGDTGFTRDVTEGPHTVLLHNCNANGPDVAPMLLSVQVTADQTTTLSPALAPGGHIAGTIRLPAGSDPTKACAAAQAQGQTVTRDACADAAGHYVIDSLGTGNYRTAVNFGSLSLGFNNATTEAALTALPIKAGCVTTLDYDLVAMTTTLVGRDCSGLPECVQATARVNHENALVAKAKKKFKKAKKKLKKAHGHKHKVLKKKTKKAKKKLKHQRKAQHAAAAAAYPVCH